MQVFFPSNGNGTGFDYNCDVICEVALAKQSYQFYMEQTPSSSRGFHRKQSIILRRKRERSISTDKREKHYFRLDNAGG
jgi:hypothetical protein